MVFESSLEGVAPNNDIGNEYKDHIRKFVPVLKSYNLDLAADHLRLWVDGALKPAPLLDVSATLASKLSSCDCCAAIFGGSKFINKLWPSSVHYVRNLEFRVFASARCYFPAESTPHALRTGFESVRNFEPKPNVMKLLGWKPKIQ